MSHVYNLMQWLYYLRWYTLEIEAGWSRWIVISSDKFRTFEYETFLELKESINIKANATFGHNHYSYATRSGHFHQFGYDTVILINNTHNSSCTNLYYLCFVDCNTCWQRRTKPEICILETCFIMLYKQWLLFKQRPKCTLNACLISTVAIVIISVIVQ